MSVMLAGAVGAQNGNSAPDTVAARKKAFPRPATATWYSVGFTVVPTVAGMVIGANSNSSGAGGLLAFGGMVVGPAAGYWYGGIGSKAWPGLLLRTGGMVVAALGAGSCVSVAWGDTGGCSSGATAAMVGGGLLVIGSAIYDMATVGRKVSAHNTALLNASLVPIFQPSRRSVGLEVIIGF